MACIEHTQRKKYGTTSRKVGGVVRYYLLHRLAYCDHEGISPDAIDGMVVRHTCDNPRCINPAHLELGTHQDNMLDMTSRGRSAVGERQHLAKVSDADAQAIYDEYRKGGVSLSTLAARYGLGKTGAHSIIHIRKSVCRN